jgi:hypothetical protein
MNVSTAESHFQKSGSCGLWSRIRSRAFSLVEVMASLFVVAVTAILCFAIVSMRDTKYDETSAIDNSSFAIDALQASFDTEGVSALLVEASSGFQERIVYRSLGDGESVPSWKTASVASLSALPTFFGPVYVAALSNGKSLSSGRAVEFDVSLSWLAPGTSGETLAQFQARRSGAAVLCTFKAVEPCK